jgi:hypothetical protein
LQLTVVVMKSLHRAVFREKYYAYITISFLKQYVTMTLSGKLRSNQVYFMYRAIVL